MDTCTIPFKIGLPWCIKAPWNNWWPYKVVYPDPVKDRTRTMLPAHSLFKVSSPWACKEYSFSQKRFTLILFYVNVGMWASAPWWFCWPDIGKFHSICDLEKLQWYVSQGPPYHPSDHTICQCLTDVWSKICLLHICKVKELDRALQFTSDRFCNRVSPPIGLSL